MAHQIQIQILLSDPFHLKLDSPCLTVAFSRVFQVSGENRASPASSERQ